MSGQPVKKRINYEERLSNEVKNIFSEIREILPLNYPLKEITIEAFLLYTLEKEDCFLYKALYNFLNSTSIENIHNALSVLVQKGTPGVEGATIELSASLKNLLAKANDESENMKCNTITSDHILLGLLKDDKTKSDSRRYFINNGLTYNIYVKYCREMHEIASQVLESEEIKDTVSEPLKPTNSSPKKHEGYVPFTKLLNNDDKLSGETVIGRDDEIKQMINILNRKNRNNILIVGESGVGKTNLIKGLTQEINQNNVPEKIENANVYYVNNLELLAGCQVRGSFEEKISDMSRALRNDASRHKCILVMDSIVDSDKDYNLGTLLGDILNESKIGIVITTTYKGLKTLRDTSASLLKKFEQIDLKEPSIEMAIDILKGLQKSYEKFHNVSYTKEAISASVRLSKQYLTEKFLPQSAIDVLDEAGALKYVESTVTQESVKLRQEISTLSEKKAKLLKNDEIDEINEIDDKIQDINLKLIKLSENETTETVTEEDICQIISKHTNIPLQKLSVSEKKKLSNIDALLKETVIGQDEAIETVTRAVKRKRLGIFNKNKPLSFMCIGSTGCGKTYLAKQLAKEVFGGEDYLVRFDMSEYADRTATNKLIGTGAGYVGYQNGGLLTEAIKNKKYCVLLIDEIEKANEEIYNVFLQILDDGVLTDNMGQKVDFKNVIIMMTSNVGAKEAAHSKVIGFEANDSVNKKAVIEKELKNKFPPEFINRLDDVIYFNILNDDNYKSIIKLELEKMSSKLTDNGYTIVYPTELIDYIFNVVKKEKEYGARPIARAIQNEVENKIVDTIISNENVKEIHIHVSDKIDINI